jgi:hypothetical protein
MTGAPWREELHLATAGLVYSSEGDHPFELFALDEPRFAATPDGTAFAALVDAPADSPIDETTLAAFLARHTDATDPFDVETQRIRPRYEALQRLIEGRLRHVRVFRIGAIRVRCYVVGLDPEGRLSGLATTAIET